MRAALDLADQDVVVLGADATAEGLVQAVEAFGVRFDPVFVAVNKPGDSLQRLLTQLGLQASPVNAPQTASWVQQVLYLGPQGLVTLLADKVGLDECNRLIELMAQAHEQLLSGDAKQQEDAWRYFDGLSFAFWLNDAGMPAFVLEAFNALCRSRFAVSSGEVSAAAALQAFGSGVLPNKTFSLAQVARTQDEATATEDLPPLLYALPGGTASLYENLSRALGDRLQSGSRATRVEADAQGGWRIHYKKGNGNGEQIMKVKALVLATSAKRALDLAADSLDERTRVLLGQESASSAVSVHLFSNKPLWTKSFELFLPQGSLFTLLYAQNPAQPLADEAKVWVTSLRLTARNSRDKLLLDFSDEQLLQAVFADLERIAPGTKQLVNKSLVQRHRDAFAVNGVGSAARKIEFGNLSGSSLVLGGDFLAGLGVNGSAEAGELAAVRVRVALTKASTAPSAMPVPDSQTDTSAAPGNQAVPTQTSAQPEGGSPNGQGAPANPPQPGSEGGTSTQSIEPAQSPSQEPGGNQPATPKAQAKGTDAPETQGGSVDSRQIQELPPSQVAPPGANLPPQSPAARPADVRKKDRKALATPDTAKP